MKRCKNEQIKTTNRGCFAHCCIYCVVVNRIFYSSTSIGGNFCVARTIRDLCSTSWMEAKYCHGFCCIVVDSFVCNNRILTDDFAFCYCRFCCWLLYAL